MYRLTVPRRRYDSTAHYGPKNLFKIVTKSIRMEGFLAFDFYNERAEFDREMAALVASGKIKVVEHVTHGLGNAGAAFVDMMAGKNIGKAVVLLD